MSQGEEVLAVGVLAVVGYLPVGLSNLAVERSVVVVVVVLHHEENPSLSVWIEWTKEEARAAPANWNGKSDCRRPHRPSGSAQQPTAGALGRAFLPSFPPSLPPPANFLPSFPSSKYVPRTGTEGKRALEAGANCYSPPGPTVAASFLLAACH